MEMVAVVNEGVPGQRRSTRTPFACNDLHGHGLVTPAAATTVGRCGHAPARPLRTTVTAPEPPTTRKRRERGAGPRRPHVWPSPMSPSSHAVRCGAASPHSWRPWPPGGFGAEWPHGRRARRGRPCALDRLAFGAVGGAEIARPRRRPRLQTAGAARGCCRRRGRRPVDPSSTAVRRRWRAVQLACHRRPVPLALAAPACRRCSAGRGARVTRGGSRRGRPPLPLSPALPWKPQPQPWGWVATAAWRQPAPPPTDEHARVARVRLAPGGRRHAPTRGCRRGGSRGGGRRHADRPCRHRRPRLAHVRAWLPRTPAPRSRYRRRCAYAPAGRRGTCGNQRVSAKPWHTHIHTGLKAMEGWSHAAYGALRPAPPTAAGPPPRRCQKEMYSPDRVQAVWPSLWIPTRVHPLTGRPHPTLERLAGSGVAPERAASAPERAGGATG